MGSILVSVRMTSEGSTLRDVVFSGYSCSVSVGWPDPGTLRVRYKGCDAKDVQIKMQQWHNVRIVYESNGDKIGHQS
jgi:hypothetical protein